VPDEACLGRNERLCMSARKRWVRRLIGHK
jgi:hypothetical protein